MPSEQTEDQIVTAGHQGRDKDLLLLLCALAVSCWTRRDLCVCVCVPGAQLLMGGSVPWLQTLSEQGSSSISVLFLLPTLCSHRLLSLCIVKVYGDGKFDYFCAE